MFGLFLGISTYRRWCLNCGLMYRYQEWEDGLHNFDDHMLLSLHLCLMFRNALQVTTCHSNVLVLHHAEVYSQKDNVNSTVVIEHSCKTTSTTYILK